MFHTHRTRNPGGGGGDCSSIYGFGRLTSFHTKNIDWLWKSPWKAITLSLKDEPSLQKVFTIITLYMKVKYAMQGKIHIWFTLLKDKYTCIFVKKKKMVKECIFAHGQLLKYRTRQDTYMVHTSLPPNWLMRGSRGGPDPPCKTKIY